jgi:hypothetical protein
MKYISQHNQERNIIIENNCVFKIPHRRHPSAFKAQYRPSPAAIKAHAYKQALKKYAIRKVSVDECRKYLLYYANNLMRQPEFANYEFFLRREALENPFDYIKNIGEAIVVMKKNSVQISDEKLKPEKTNLSSEEDEKSTEDLMSEDKLSIGSPVSGDESEVIQSSQICLSSVGKYSFQIRA